MVGSMLTPMLVRRVRLPRRGDRRAGAGGGWLRVLTQPFTQLGLAVLLVGRSSSPSASRRCSRWRPTWSSARAARARRCRRRPSPRPVPNSAARSASRSSAASAPRSTAPDRRRGGGRIPPGARRLRGRAWAPPSPSPRNRREAADALVSLARQAFTQGLQVMSLIAACTMVATALVFDAQVLTRPLRDAPEARRALQQPHFPAPDLSGGSPQRVPAAAGGHAHWSRLTARR